MEWTRFKLEKNFIYPPLFHHSDYIELFWLVVSLRKNREEMMPVGSIEGMVDT